MSEQPGNVPPPITQALTVTQHHMALEPANVDQAFRLAKMAVESGMLPRAIQKPEQAMMVLMRGRELGLTAMQSFASVHVIDGKTSLSAELIVALVKRRRDLCKYFQYVEGDTKQATFKTLRIGSDEPTELTFTIEQAQSLGLTGKDNWKKQTANMLRWRAATALARLEYPELTLGLYSTDEIEDIETDRGPARGASGPVVVEGEFSQVAPAAETEGEPIESAIERWKTVLKDATELSTVSAVSAEIAGKLAKTHPSRKELIVAGEAAKKRIKTKAAPVELPPQEREPGSDDE